MLKLGKPKASFDKAVNEIEAYMKDPTGSQVVITPARKTSLTKVRPSITSAEDSLIAENEEELNDVESKEEPETPKKVTKVPVKKSSTVS